MKLFNLCSGKESARIRTVSYARKREHSELTSDQNPNLQSYLSRYVNEVGNERKAAKDDDIAAYTENILCSVAGLAMCRGPATLRVTYRLFCPKCAHNPCKAQYLKDPTPNSKNRQHLVRRVSNNDTNTPKSVWLTIPILAGESARPPKSRGVERKIGRTARYIISSRDISA
jgi:hypothetical protein